MASANHDSVEDVALTDTVGLGDHLPLARGGEIWAFPHAQNCCLAPKPNKTTVRDDDSVLQRRACERLGLPGAGWVPGEAACHL